MLVPPRNRSPPSPSSPPAAIEPEASAQIRAAASNPQAWTIGPIIRGRNYSVGVPLHPTPRRGGGWQIDLPRAPGSVHDVTFRHGSLAGKRRIVMRYRIEAARGVRLLASSDGRSPSMITLYFQRRGDNWSGRGRFETYRWYATFATQTPLTPGNHVMVAPLDGAWTAVETSRAPTSPAAFRAGSRRRRPGRLRPRRRRRLRPRRLRHRPGPADRHRFPGGMTAIRPSLDRRGRPVRSQHRRGPSLGDDPTDSAEPRRDAPPSG